MLSCFGGEGEKNENIVSCRLLYISQSIDMQTCVLFAAPKPETNQSELDALEQTHKPKLLPLKVTTGSGKQVKFISSGESTVNAQRRN